MLQNDCLLTQIETVLEKEPSNVLATNNDVHVTNTSSRQPKAEDFWAALVQVALEVFDAANHAPNDHRQPEETENGKPPAIPK